tara:strand:+ start:323 stop:601 length:279 start_codon:yes stop_codon:yes gene_type:complete
MSYRVTTRDVAAYWRDGEAAHNNGGNLWTDGQYIYSYRLCIGETTSNGKKVAKAYQASTALGFRSMTTSKHVGYTLPSADLIDDGVELKEKR